MSSLREAVNSPIVTPDRKWILSYVPKDAKDTSAVLKAFPTGEGTPFIVCARCFPKWTRDQTHLFFSFVLNQRAAEFIIPLPPGKAFPKWPANGVASEADIKQLANVQLLQDAGVFPGTTPSTFALVRDTVQRNLYRIALTQ